MRARREHARRTRQRVEVRREESRNASLADREMDTSRALASKAYIHAWALRRRRAGLPGTLDPLRLAVLEDLTTGRDPMDRRTRPAADPAAADPSSEDPSSEDPSTASASEPDLATPGPAEGDADDDDAAADDGPQPGFLDYDHGEDGGSDCPNDPPRGPGPPAPMPAMINLVVHAGTPLPRKSVAGGCSTPPRPVPSWPPLPDTPPLAGASRSLAPTASPPPTPAHPGSILGPPKNRTTNHLEGGPPTQPRRLVSPRSFAA